MKLRNLIARIAGALGVVLSAGCAGTAADLPPVVAAAAPPPAGPALWRVSDSDTTIYLFGTVHALPEDAQWFDTRISNAFDASEELVTEIDMRDAVGLQARFSEAAQLSRGRNLRELMRPEDRVQYETALRALGVPLEVFDSSEPWYAALNLTILPLIQSGYNPDAGVDQVLTGRAGPKRRDSLETPDEQLALFDGLPMDAQLAMLDGAVEGMGTIAETLDAMVQRWLLGDADGLAALMNADMDNPTLANRLLYERNVHWADWIETRMQTPGTIFMAVGAGHLAGTGSVQDLLGQRGREVERVWK
jgi:uncharacterized protein YbaP (TraB family)